MNCPKCDNHKTKVYDSRKHPSGTYVVRRRRCRCGNRFVTAEFTQEALKDEALDIDWRGRSADNCLEY